MKFIAIILMLGIVLGCSNCKSSQTTTDPNAPEPYVRIESGIEYCGPMCDLFKKMNCVPFYEDVTTEDGGKMTCKEFCEYEQSNSIQLNPKCIVDNLKYCYEIDLICK